MSPPPTDASSFTSPRLAELFSLEGLVLREDLQQDKRSALLAVVRMFDDFQVPYVISGGIAVQLYTPQPRHTVDVDVVSLRKPFERLKTAQPWTQYQFELVFDRRRFIKLRHVPSGVEIDINVDTRFTRLLDEPVVEMVEGRSIAFCGPAKLALTKLRTQRSDWPRDPGKRLQDRTDLVKMLQAHPEIAVPLQADPLTNDEMRQILNHILADLRKPSSDELPPENDESDED